MCVVLKLNPRKYPVNLDRKETPLPRGSHTAPEPIPDLQKRGLRRLSVLLRTVSSKCPANQQESPSGVKDSALTRDGVLGTAGTPEKVRRASRGTRDPCAPRMGFPIFL